MLTLGNEKIIVKTFTEIHSLFWKWKYKVTINQLLLLRYLSRSDIQISDVSSAFSLSPPLTFNNIHKLFCPGQNRPNNILLSLQTWEIHTFNCFHLQHHQKFFRLQCKSSQISYTSTFYKNHFLILCSHLIEEDIRDQNSAHFFYPSSYHNKCFEIFPNLRLEIPRYSNGR